MKQVGFIPVVGSFLSSVYICRKDLDGLMCIWRYLISWQWVQGQARGTWCGQIGSLFLVWLGTLSSVRGLRVPQEVVGYRGFCLSSLVPVLTGSLTRQNSNFIWLFKHVVMVLPQGGGSVSGKLTQVFPRPLIICQLPLRLLSPAPSYFSQGVFPFSSGEICLGVSSFTDMGFWFPASISFLLPGLNLLEVPFSSGLLVTFGFICMAVFLSLSQ